MKTILCIKSFILNNNSAEKNINIKKALFFFFVKKPGLKSKKKKSLTLIIWLSLYNPTQNRRIAE